MCIRDRVESDDVIVNFSAIETFYPDKRPFFIENQTLFDVTGYNLRFINTRRIGGIPDKCSETAESHKGECSDSLIDTTDINYALRYTRREIRLMNLAFLVPLKTILFILMEEIFLL